MSRYIGNHDACPGRGILYKDFRTRQPLTYYDVYLMLWVPEDEDKPMDTSDWRYKRRHTVLGKWHQIKQEDWRAHIRDCDGPPPEDELPF